MADNVKFQTPRPATAPGGTIVATDNIYGVDYQRMKLTLGEDGVDAGDVSSTNPMPVAVDGDAVEEGGIVKQLVQDNNQEQLLTDILKELKKLNMHMALMTDTCIASEEVE